MIREGDFLKAIVLIKEYAKQVEDMEKEAKAIVVRFLTPKQIRHDINNLAPDIDTGLLHVLMRNFPDTRLCDITKNDFKSKRGAGQYRWTMLQVLIGKC